MTFIEDIQLIFSNAKKFNAAFKETDIESKNVYDDAVAFEERVITSCGTPLLLHIYYIGGFSNRR
jgi:hypothetical protein